MADLLKITPALKQVKLYGMGGKEVDVRGLSVKSIGYLVKRHPQIIDLMQGKGGGFKDLSDLIDLGTEFVTDFLAFGLGYDQDSKDLDQAREVCASLPAEDVWNVGEAILNVSFPGGSSAFFQKVASATNQAFTVEKENSNSKGKVRKAAKKSPGQKVKKAS